MSNYILKLYIKGSYMENSTEMESPAEANNAQGDSVIWFYEENGSRIGGVTEKEIASLIENGTITYGTSVWKEGFPEWLIIENTELRKYLAKVSPPPLKGEKVNNTVVWVLAFAPVIGIFLEGFIAGLLYGDSYRVELAISNAEFWYVTVALNIILCVLDERKLKSAGQDTSKFKGWVWLIPVYLYQRAKKLNQSLAYFIVWLICFAIMIFA